MNFTLDRALAVLENNALAAILGFKTKHCVSIDIIRETITDP
jgi:hypothetical protein